MRLLIRQITINTRENVIEFEIKSLEKSVVKEYKDKKTKSIFYDETRNNYLVTSGKEKFKINNFLVILDRLLIELNKRRIAYHNIYVSHLILLSPSLKV